MYDCTHCFNCIDACPKGVDPMSQIMRLRRRAGDDYHINDRNNGYRHEHAFVTLIREERPAARGRAAAAVLRRRLVVRQVPPGARRRSSWRRCRRRSPAVAARQDDVREARAASAQDPPRSDLKQVKEIYEEIDGREPRVELNLYVTGYEDEDQVESHAPHDDEPDDHPAAPDLEPAATPEPEEDSMKVAYWPGCVSRGFTPELHGSMAKVAPLLDIELIELDRADCCGAGVIAEHNQELADTLNARTFALAQQTDGELMMNICSTCQGAQSECQERLDANTEYRDHVNAHLADEGLSTRRA